MSGTARSHASSPESETVVSDDATVRDRVWDATFDLISRRPLPFQAWRVRRRAGLSEDSDRTIRRTLSVMESAGWLEHEKNSKWWHPGPKAEERFDEYGE